VKKRSLDSLLLISLSLLSARSLADTNANSDSDKKIHQSAELKAELSQGTFEVDTHWVTVQQTSSEEETLNGNIRFIPKPIISNCSNLSFIQSVRIQNNAGGDYKWPVGQSARNAMRTKKNSSEGVAPGFFIDHDASRCEAKDTSCSPYYRDSWPNENDGSQDGSVKNGKVEDAFMVDYPYGWGIISQAHLEACAVCRESAEILGCVNWGGTWPTIGERTLDKITASEKPSATFLRALKNFNLYYNRK